MKTSLQRSFQASNALHCIALTAIGLRCQCIVVSQKLKLAFLVFQFVSNVVSRNAMQVWTDLNKWPVNAKALNGSIFQQISHSKFIHWQITSHIDDPSLINQNRMLMHILKNFEVVFQWITKKCHSIRERSLLCQRQGKFHSYFE